MKENSKAADLVRVLRGGWTRQIELMTQTGWQAHSVRGAISTLKKKHGMKVERQRIEGVTSYRIAE